MRLPQSLRDFAMTDSERMIAERPQLLQFITPPVILPVGARTAGEYGSVIARRLLADVAISLLSLFKP